LAVFLGNKGAELFYLQKEGPSSVTLEKVRLENQDEQTFSVFISDELQLLKTWYENLPLQERTLENKNQRIKSIQNKFLQEVVPRLKSSRRSSFYKKELNNASLLLYKTYSSHLDEFEKLYRMQQSDFQKFIDVCKKLEKSDDPQLALKKMVDIPSTH
jgi:predicted aminopeptidase